MLITRLYGTSSTVASTDSLGPALAFQINVIAVLTYKACTMLITRLYGTNSTVASTDFCLGPDTNTDTASTFTYFTANSV
jgi:hypothetical protein